ncbi:hypothetical protein N7478_013181 [Penicillium angulare]|uniref:uncharacterized protein n=1 Tax=Penicillium angulare TaxID=116970 RepID=UPI0025413C2E|nr:uncharacterized protein N7478_013181 [Penicillium angulare]KAJ5257077.1 hypothetical protein N7478_013181 [Penicillium angulare]
MAQNQPAVICVFCGSTPGKSPEHLEAARKLAQEFHKHNVQLVYGGGTIGLMGEIAKTLVSLSGPQSVHGFIPRALIRRVKKSNDAPFTNGAGKVAERIIDDEALDQDHIPESEFGVTTIVEDMHTRKRLMAEKVSKGGPGSGFVTLAGGFGTIEEIMEMTTWNQLGIHSGGIVVLNIRGYWDALFTWIRSAVEEGFISAENAAILVEVQDPKEVWPRLVEYQVSSGRMTLDWGK